MHINKAVAEATPAGKSKYELQAKRKATVQDIVNPGRLESGKITINNIRKEQGLQPIDGGDELLTKCDVVAGGKGIRKGNVR